MSQEEWDEGEGDQLDSGLEDEVGEEQGGESEVGYEQFECDEDDEFAPAPLGGAGSNHGHLTDPEDE